MSGNVRRGKVFGEATQSPLLLKGQCKSTKTLGVEGGRNFRRGNIYGWLRFLASVFPPLLTPLFVPCSMRQCPASAALGAWCPHRCSLRASTCFSHIQIRGWLFSCRGPLLLSSTLPGPSFYSLYTRTHMHTHIHIYTHTRIKLYEES